MAVPKSAGLEAQSCHVESVTKHMLLKAHTSLYSRISVALNLRDIPCTPEARMCHQSGALCIVNPHNKPEGLYYMS